MPIQTELLIAAPMLQDYLVDKDTGLPLVAGIVTMYSNAAQTQLKPWYYQVGIGGGPYTYSPLDNPLTLSAVGTIQDPNGNDVIPFYYPYTSDDPPVFDPYYVTVTNADLELQFTRDNFPFVGTPQEIQTRNILNNFVINSSFWRNIETLDVTSELNAVVAPGQHDDYQYPDIRFRKSVVNSTPNSETITFRKFLPNEQLVTNTITGDITPEYYLNYACTAVQVGELLKCIQIPISTHLATLKAQDGKATITVWARFHGSGSPITLSYLQDFGSGISPAADPVVVATETLTSSWQKFTVSFPLPSTVGLTLSDGGDDAFYIQIGFPLSAECNIDIASPSFYLGDTIATNSFETYDQVDAIINSPRTGDWKASLADFTPFGWVALSDGTIGDASSGSTYASINNWPLFSLLWNKFNLLSENGSPYWPIYDSAGVASTYSLTSAYADWIAHKRLSLPKSLGRTLIGSDSAGIVSPPFTTSGSEFVIASTASLYTGAPIVFTNLSDTTKGVSLNTVYYVVIISTTNLRVAATYADAIAGTPLITLTDAITGNIVSGLTATYTGEFAHKQLLTEIVNHTHDPDPSATAYWESVTPPGGASSVGTGPPPANATNFPTTGGVTGLVTQQGINVVQPSTYYNVFLKL